MFNLRFLNKHFLKKLANRSFHSSKMSNLMNHSFFERIAHSLIFRQKMSDSLGNQMSEFVALIENN